MAGGPSRTERVYYLLAAVLMVGLMLWRPFPWLECVSSTAALPVTRLDLAAPLPARGRRWDPVRQGAAVLLAVGGLSSVGLSALFLFG